MGRHSHLYATSSSVLLRVDESGESHRVSQELGTRVEGRQHVLGLQRRRFWRELAFSAAILSADALAVAIVLVLLAQLPLHVGPQHAEFLMGLIPLNPPALLRRGLN